MKEAEDVSFSDFELTEFEERRHRGFVGFHRFSMAMGTSHLSLFGEVCVQSVCFVGIACERLAIQLERRDRRTVAILDDVVDQLPP